MKRIVIFLIALTAATGSIPAQNRNITRGATEGELYYSVNWYCKYDPNYNDTMYRAILHLTENGKKAEITYGVAYIEPNTATPEYPMTPEAVIADATPGVLYNADFYCSHDAYWYNRLWVSFDYGKNWELRDEPDNLSTYFVADIEGIIYRTGWDGTYESNDYAETFVLINDKKISAHEPGLKDCEFFSLIGRGFYHTYDCFQNYINLSIDEQFVYGQMGGFFPDIFRGSLPGEVYVTSGFPNKIYKVSFSADTGYNFRVVHQREGFATFMSDRKAGDFYIVTEKIIETQQPWGWHTRLYIEHYTDYGETLAGTYCHDLTRDGVVTAVEEKDAYSDILVYPNPTDGVLHVETHNYASLRQIDVFDVFGRNVFTVETHGRASLQQPMTIINISHLPAGMYFVRITIDKTSIVKKIIKL